MFKKIMIKIRKTVHHYISNQGSLWWLNVFVIPQTNFLEIWLS